MNLYELIKDVKVIGIIGAGTNDSGGTALEGTDISHMTYSTGDIQKGSLFFCLEGTRIDGHTMAETAARLGASVIVTSRQIETPKGCIQVVMQDTKEAMALLAARFYGQPANRLDLIGFTGTNGKTTSTFMLRSIFENSGIKTGLMGTIYNTTGSRMEAAARTTMESLDLHRELSIMNEDGDRVCVMEVSSHSLALKRVFGLYFKIGIFTNLTQDHLDFHGTMEKYFEAKQRLFQASGCSVINMDDEYGRRIAPHVTGNLVTYGITGFSNCDVSAEHIAIDESGSCFNLCYRSEKLPIRLRLPGKFNIYNALGAAAAAFAYGLKIHDIKRGLEALQAVPGRSELIKSTRGFSVVIDYAHTPDGIWNILATAREYTRGRLIVLFGCGGDRDKTKRPLMGNTAGRLADFCIITSDNPRSEEPEAIIDDIIPGILQTGCPYEIIADRKEAIAHALNIARENDVVVIAGKGHETYQILKDKTIHFDEREIVGELLKEEQIQ